MMEEVAKVIDCDADGWVRVEVKVKNACNHCDNNESCGTSAVSKAFSPKVQQFSVQAQGEYHAGELLKLGLPESVILKAAAIVYLLPLLGLFVGASVARFAFPVLDIATGDGLIVLAALLGGVSAWLLGRRWARKLETNSQPIILGRLGQTLSTSN
ncbi:SoxR reducing system RseC family protein [Shewanella colwelliana]|uniref:SoxR reducing system RseC family protein n=1 Tax=Shewanella colwelliana TaxID=23 RepID=UPI0022AF85C1|nr:SoxR reducing system RseC family protein [Shewanella colwelliana]MCZ4336215.1 SoxR reducing system RseC family protein [Shewanella colwelliana]